MKDKIRLEINDQEIQLDFFNRDWNLTFDEVVVQFDFVKISQIIMSTF